MSVVEDGVNVVGALLEGERRMTDLGSTVPSGRHDDHLMIILETIDEAAHLVGATEPSAVENDDRIALTVELIIYFGVAALSLMSGGRIIAVGRFARRHFFCLTEILQSDHLRNILDGGDHFVDEKIFSRVANIFLIT